MDIALFIGSWGSSVFSSREFIGVSINQPCEETVSMSCCNIFWVDGISLGAIFTFETSFLPTVVACFCDSLAYVAFC